MKLIEKWIYIYIEIISSRVISGFVTFGDDWVDRRNDSMKC